MTSQLQAAVLEVERDLAKGLSSETLDAVVSGAGRSMRSQLLDPASPVMAICGSARLPAASKDTSSSSPIVVVDIGGSTLRVGLVRFVSQTNDSRATRDATPRAFNGCYPLREWDLTGCLQMSGREVFEWLAGRIHGAVAEYYTSAKVPATEDAPAAVTLELLSKEKKDKCLPIAVSWSFPVIPRDHGRSATIVDMGKGWSHVAADIKGWDLRAAFAQGFADAAERDNTLPEQRLPMEVCAVVNDAEAVLLAAAYCDPRTRIALILGTGVNAAAQVPLPPSSAPGVTAVVNTELSLLGGTADTSPNKTRYLPTTEWDELVDAAVQRPGFQPLETRVGGQHVGELARRCLAQSGDASSPWSAVPPYGLSAKIMAHATTLSAGDPQQVKRYLEAHVPGLVLGAASEGTEAARLAVRVFVAVMSRAASLVAAHLVALAQLILGSPNTSAGQPLVSPVLPEQPLVVTCCGSVVVKYPGFLAQCQRAVSQLAVRHLPNGSRIQLTVGADGSLYGPAVACLLNAQPAAEEIH